MEIFKKVWAPESCRRNYFKIDVKYQLIHGVLLNILKG